MVKNCDVIVSKSKQIGLSVIIPTRNRFKDVARILETLVSQIVEGKLDGRAEIIVVDDGSRSSIGQRIKELADKLQAELITVIRLDKNRGCSYARNTGARKSTGNIILFLDDDLLPRKDFLIETINVHKKHPEALVIVGDLEKYRNNYYSNLWYERYCSKFKKPGFEFYQVPRLSSGNLSVKRQLLIEMGPLFDESLPSREDFDLYLRLERKGIGVFKCDRMVALNDSHKTLWGVIKRTAWYTKGECCLRRKYGADYLSARQLEIQTSSVTQSGILFWFLRVVRKFVYGYEAIKQYGRRKSHL
jgi:glycosyltransferase involved in cell wall biosynthesis